MALHTELWFPSVVWSGMLHSPDNTTIKHFAYQRKKNDVGVEVSNYLGWQSTYIEKYDCFAIDDLISTIDKEVSLCAKQTGLPTLEIQNLWININPKGAYNHLHDHLGAVLTGVYYVDANEQQGNLQLERSDNAEYFLPEFPDKHTYFTSTRATYKAQTGALYLFPAWMKHSVQGNQTDKDRISISFNYGVKTDAS